MKNGYIFMLLIDGILQFEIEDDNFNYGFQRISDYLQKMKKSKFDVRVSIVYVPKEK